MPEVPEGMHIVLKVLMMVLVGLRPDARCWRMPVYSVMSANQVARWTRFALSSCTRTDRLVEGLKQESCVIGSCLDLNRSHIQASLP
jgi:hypothetical protein